jgi:hypothetical protein
VSSSRDNFVFSLLYMCKRFPLGVVKRKVSLAAERGVADDSRTCSDRTGLYLCLLVKLASNAAVACVLQES